MNNDREPNGLRRGKPLERKTPMQRGTKGLSPGKGLQRKTPLTSKPPAGADGTPHTTGLQRRTPLPPSKPLPPSRPERPDGDAPRRPIGLQRRTPLSNGSAGLSRSGSGLSQSAGLDRTAPSPRASSTTPGERAEEKAPRRMPQQSKKRQAELPERRRIVAAVLAIEPVCLAPHCNNPSQDGHERKTRARGGSTLSPWNIVGVCRQCNLALTDEPAWGYETGLLLHSWDDEPTEPLWWLSDDQKAALRRVHDERWSPKSVYEVELWYEKRRSAAA